MEFSLLRFPLLGFAGVGMPALRQCPVDDLIEIPVSSQKTFTAEGKHSAKIALVCTEHTERDVANRGVAPEILPRIRAARWLSPPVPAQWFDQSDCSDAQFGNRTQSPRLRALLWVISRVTCWDGSG